MGGGKRNGCRLLRIAYGHYTYYTYDCDKEKHIVSLCLFRFFKRLRGYTPIPSCPFHSLLLAKLLLAGDAQLNSGVKREVSGRGAAAKVISPIDRE